MRKTPSGIVYMGHRWWEEETGEESPIRIVPLTNEERGSGPLRLGPFMLVVSKDYLESIKKDELPKEAYGL